MNDVLTGLSNIQIILVEPSHPGNIGAVARAMKTMGLTQLVLINPQKFPAKEATERAAGADDVLYNATVCPTLLEAVQGCHYIFACSARMRSLSWLPLTPPEASQQIKGKIQCGQNVAVVFGRESSGLTNEELQLCHSHVLIPANKDYSSLNLAAAVQVICYELRMQFLTGETIIDTENRKGDRARSATSEELEGFFQHLESCLKQIEFLNPSQPRKLMSRLRRLYLRTNIDEIELNILRGILAATEKSVQEKK